MESTGPEGGAPTPPAGIPGMSAYAAFNSGAAAGTGAESMLPPEVIRRFIGTEPDQRWLYHSNRPRGEKVVILKWDGNNPG